MSLDVSIRPLEPRDIPSCEEILRGHAGYKETRAFYSALGFTPLEETKAFWGKDNPCLIMVKPLLPFTTC